jgi:NAD(P)-dependent dehydrogenase (short-subunit alcohol dehydrogenase family)
MKQLEGRIAIVTGASTGIGKAIAKEYSQEGAVSVAVARSPDKLGTLVQEIASAGGRAEAIAADVSIEADVQRVFSSVLQRYGRVDILVNNAGITSRLPTDELPLADWERVIAVNVTGAFLCAREALRAMKPRRSGRIINIGSVAAKAPRPDSIAYTTSKSALEGMTRSLAIDARDWGIGVSVLQPGNTRTELWTRRGALAEKEGIMDPRDVARVAVLIASLPNGTNLFEAIVHPIRMPWMGRG